MNGKVLVSVEHFISFFQNFFSNQNENKVFDNRNRSQELVLRVLPKPSSRP